MDDNVIKFDSIKPPIQIKDKTPEQCRCNHNNVLLNRATRQVDCKDCNVYIDPFDYLLSWAYGDIHLDLMRKRLRAEVTRISGNLEKLKKEERNIKARVRNLRKKEIRNE